MGVVNKPLLSLEDDWFEDGLLIQGLAGSERVSSMFVFRIDLAAKVADAEKFPAKRFLGKPFGVRLSVNEVADRHFHGMVAQFLERGRDDRYVYYRAELIPWLSYLARNANCRIFQKQTVPQIIESVFESHGIHDYRLALRADYQPWDYCVQYRESDFHFVSRLMEQEGIFTFFEHEYDRHRLVLADEQGAIRPCPHESTLIHNHFANSGRHENVVTTWETSDTIQTDRHVLRDYHFQTPRNPNEAGEQTLYPTQHGLELEAYEPTNSLENRYNEPDLRLENLPDEARRLARLRMEADEADAHRCRSMSYCGALIAGFSFKLEGQIDERHHGEYLLTSVEHHARQAIGDFSGNSAETTYENAFSCLPIEITYRPQRTIPKPIVPGIQTAQVVGPRDQDVYVDRYGRVKVQFHWDRAPIRDEADSCWIRVAQFWAGQQWGAHYWPRVGHEVVVAFVEGDPDQPLIVGSVYNAVNTPPYPLPESAHLSGIKSRSMNEGGSEEFNEIRFNDKKEHEQLYIHAQRNLDTVVEADETRSVGVVRYTKVGRSDVSEILESRIVCIGKEMEQSAHHVSDRALANNYVDAQSVYGNRHSFVEGSDEYSLFQGDHTLDIREGNRSVRIMGDDRLEVEDGDVNVKVASGNYKLEAGATIELRVGDSCLKLDQAGITLEGAVIEIKGKYGTKINGKAVMVNGDVGVSVQGKLVTIN